MIYLGVSFLVFVATAFFHLIFYKKSLLKQTVLANLLIFLIGLIGELIIISYLSINNTFPKFSADWKFVPLPFSSLTFYILLSVTYLIYLSSIILADKSPSNTIIEMIINGGKISRKRLINKFAKSNFIEKRLAEMVKTELILENDSTYTVTVRGKTIARLIETYRQIYKWDEGG